MYSDIYHVCVKYLYPGKIIREKELELEKLQWLSRSEIEATQFEKIKRLIEYAYENVPFYRELYHREDIHPRDIKTLKDFQNLPFLTRDDVMKHFRELCSTEFKGSTFSGKTSGSTGNPMEYTMEKSEIWRTFAYNARCRGWYGIKPGDKRAFVTATLEPYSNWSRKEKISAKIKRYRYLDVRTMTESRMRDFAEMLVKWQPAMFRVYPSAMEIFARFLKERKITDIRPKLIESTAEKVTPLQRQLFEDVFKAAVADHYAALEIYSYAYQCPEGGLHVNEDRYLELVENGKVVDDGKMGEVIVTSLNQYAMPFIRYKNGDIAVYEPDGCSCGREIPVLREVVGRDCDLLVNSDGQVVHWSVVHIIMMGRIRLEKLQIYQPDRHNLEIRIVCKEEVSQQYLEEIRQELQPLFGKSFQISFKIMDHIPISAGGKFRGMISEVKPDSYNN